MFKTIQTSYFKFLKMLAQLKLRRLLKLVSLQETQYLFLIMLKSIIFKSELRNITYPKKQIHQQTSYRYLSFYLNVKKSLRRLKVQVKVFPQYSERYNQ